MAAALSGVGLHRATDIRETFDFAFRLVTGRAFEEVREDFEDQGLADGGMSSGWVSIDWWRRTGLPLIEARFERIRHALPTEGFFD